MNSKEFQAQYGNPDGFAQPKKPKARQLEHQMQVSVFKWMAAQRQKYPELEWAFAIANGGQRNVIVATKLKREGVRKGILDICIPCARGPYHGMFLELKVKPNKLTPEQEQFMRFGAAQDYFMTWCYDLDKAIGQIEWYMNL